MSTMLIFATDGQERRVKGTLTLEQMQAHVGGFIELVRFPGGEAFVNEDGLRMRLLVNERASLIIGRPIVGNVVIVRERKAKR